MPRVAKSLNCNESEIIELNEIANSSVYSEDMKRRAKIILLANDGMQNKAIAEELRSNENTVALWRNRFLENRVPGLQDLERPGRRGSLGKNKRQEVIAAAQHNNTATLKELAEQSGTSEATARRALNDAGITLGDKRAYEIKASLGLNKACVDIKGLYISGASRAIVLRIDNSLVQTMDEGTLFTRNRELATESGDNSSLADILKQMCVSKKENTVKEVRLDEFLKRTDDSLEGIKHMAVILSPKYKLPSGFLLKNMELITMADETSWLANVAMCFRFMSDEGKGKETFDALDKYIQTRTATEESFVWTRDNLVFQETPLSSIEENMEVDRLFSGNSSSNCAWVKYGYATRDGEYAEFCSVKYDILPAKNEGIYDDTYKVTSYMGEVVTGVRSLFAEPQKQLAEEYMNQNCKKKTEPGYVK